MSHRDVARGALLGRGAVLVWNDVTPEGREQFYQWHDKEHIPERLAIPGFQRGRRYSCRGHSPEWLTLYEADDIDVVVSPGYMEKLNAPTPATVKTLQYFFNTSRAVCSVTHSVGTSNGGFVLALRLEAPSDRTDDMCAYLTSEAFPRALETTGVLACHLFAADQSASHLDTAESSTREFDVPSWVVLVEASSPEGAQAARDLVGAEGLQRFGASVRKDAAIYALEICRLRSPDPAN
jgi:hypothetical protein